ncbi:TetR/AcrR family transcriptional regulator [Paenibacillus sp. BR2-3]|uniref:TetR/AcrR family transcriptional regulator n=1 Tax=Paenibacillus sp. BR2-3 TaxID=3048494 RepID=UPI0039779E30
MNGFERRRQQKRDSILNAALELFKRHGYHKVSIAEIAQSASVSQSSVYNFFNNKENLKQELMRKLTYDDYARTRNILESGDPVKVKLEKLLVSKIDFFKNFSMHFSLESSGMEIFIKELVTDENYNNALLNLIEEGKKEGVFHDSITAKSMVAYFDIIRYYFIHNPDAVAILENNPASDMYFLFLNALLKK